MKTNIDAITAALALGLATPLSLPAITITYFADDFNSFDVLIEDVGAVGIEGPEISPSGIWSFGWQVEDLSGFPTVAEIATLTRRTSHPNPFAFMDPFHGPAFKDIGEMPLIGSDTLDGDTLKGVFNVSSGTNLDDWVWSIRLTLEEKELPPPTPVPDEGSTAIVCLGALALWAVHLRAVKTPRSAHAVAAN